MPRANSSVPRHRRHRKIVKQAKGYYGARSRTFKSAKDAVVKAGLYAYRDRRQRKRQFRRLWITRINAACRLNGTTYSAFINGLKIKGITALQLIQLWRLIQYLRNSNKYLNKISERLVKLASKVGNLK